jgi:stringent starvation protein B
MEHLPSTKPYLIRAIWEWCADNGFTPYILVHVDQFTRVPQEFVRDGEIVLNIGADATGKLKLGNDWVEFQARFSGSARDLSIPVGRIAAIYARENGAGMSFEVEETASAESQNENSAPDTPEPPPEPPRPEGGRPRLQRIK